MRIVSVLTLLALEIFLFACNSFDNKKQEVKAPEQGFSSAEDSVEFGEDQFIIDKLSAKEKAEIFIVFKDNKSVSIKDYFEKELYFLDDYAKHNAAQFYDFDKDGENELIIFNYSGGIAGFQYDFFKKNADKSYIQVYSHHGSALDIQGNKLTIYMDEFRYFFTCGACRVELPNEIYSYFDLEFHEGMFHWIKQDSTLNTKIIENLEWLKKRTAVQLSTDSDDDKGERKAYGEQLANYFFNNKRDLVETEKVFLDYYVNNDKKNFWSAFLERIQSYENENKEWVK